MTLKNFSYYKTGGGCNKLYLPNNLEELSENLLEIHKKSSSYFVLGAGSNSLISDEFWPESVIVCQNLKKLQVDEENVTCGAGVENSEISKIALKNNLFGAAWMMGLPGQIGATVRMNARCYGGEISQIATQIKVVNTKGELLTFQSSPENRDVFLGYKNTLFMKNNWVIGEVTLSLKHQKDTFSIKEQMDFCYSDREQKNQFDFPSCGCVFKNDYRSHVSVPSGRLLQSAGAKDLKVGNAEVSPHHANFIYNKGASSSEILELSLQMRELVFKEFGVWLEYEMEFLGFWSKELEMKIKEKRDEAPKVSRLNEIRGGK